jgi:hypothetical protein
VEPQIRVCSEKGKRGKNPAERSRPSPDREQCLRDHGNGDDSPVGASSSRRETESHLLERERGSRLDERSGSTDTGRPVRKETGGRERPDERGVSPGRTGAVMPGEEKTSTWWILEKDLALSSDDEEEEEIEVERKDGEVMEGSGPQRYVNQNLVLKFSIFHSRCREN